MADYYEQVARGVGRSEAGGELDDGRSDGHAEGGRKEIERVAGAAPKLGELIGLILQGRDSPASWPRRSSRRCSRRARRRRRSWSARAEGRSATAASSREIVDEVIAANPKQVEQYRGGKTTVMAFFIGQVMKATRGQANPAAAKEVVERKLASSVRSGRRAGRPVRRLEDLGEQRDPVAAFFTDSVTVASVTFLPFFRAAFL